MTQSATPTLRDELLDAILATIKGVRDDLITRIAALEARPWPKHRGVFSEGAWYDELNFVIHDGSTWVALRRTNARPGTPDCGWQLTAKRGADGKPGRDGRP